MWSDEFFVFIGGLAVLVLCTLPGCLSGSWLFGGGVAAWRTDG